MKKQTIFCVGFDLPGEEFEYIEFESKRSLLDADIIIFKPTLGEYNIAKNFQGKPLIDENDSPRVIERLTYWRSELNEAVINGKLVIIYLVKPEEAFRYSGNKNYSGTGRNRQTIDYVEQISSYSALPQIEKVVASEGIGIKIMPQAAFLSLYWKEIFQYTKYEVYVEGKFSEVILQTKSGNRILGALIHKKGNLLFLPPLCYPESKFLKWDKKGETQSWTSEALKFGKRVSSAIVGVSKVLASNRSLTPPPDWALDSKYLLAIERSILEQIKIIDQKMSDMISQHQQLENKLSKASVLRGLLFEQGKALEAAILEALSIFGFTAKNYFEGESEFDFIFSSSEGRFLGEAEGKDNKAVNIDKLSQLERNLQEDFKRDDVSEYAKGVLFGNPQRFLPLDERGEAFTAKCVSGAKRAKVALIRTPDLFSPAKYLKEHKDAVYAKACREALLKTEGEVVCFPIPPENCIGTD